MKSELEALHNAIQINPKYLCINVADLPKLPKELETCRKLNDLRLEGLELESIADLPRLPRLKKIEIKNCKNYSNPQNSAVLE